MVKKCWLDQTVNEVNWNDDPRKNKFARRLQYDLYAILTCCYGEETRAASVALRQWSTIPCRLRGVRSM